MIPSEKMVVAWLGPVNLTQVGDALVRGAKAINVTCTGDGSPSCTTIGEAFRDSAGRRLPNMLASKGADPNAPTILGAFSAGGAIAKRMGLNAQDREQIVAMMLADATYTTGGAEGPNEGFVLYAIDAIQRPDKLFVATASSSPNKTYPTGIQTMTIIRQEVEKRLGKTFQPVELPGITPAPAAVWRLNNAIFAEFPNVSHGDQVTKLAEQVWRSVLMPWLQGQGDVSLPDKPMPSWQEKDWIAKGLALLAGGVAGYAGYRWLRRGRRG